MAVSSDIKQRVAFESERRARLGVPAAAGGVLYLLSGIILNASLKELPTVGVVQGLEPALRGEANPVVSPRAAEVRYIDHHAFGLIVGNLLAAAAVLALMLVLLFLNECASFRRSETWRVARPVVLVGGVGYALLNVIHEVVLAIEAHNFVNGHDFSNAAVEKALLSTGFGGIFAEPARSARGAGANGGHGRRDGGGDARGVATSLVERAWHPRRGVVPAAV